MPLAPREIRRSPSPQEEDDGEEWPVYGIVGEDVDVFGNSIYEVRWRNWSRPDGTNTTWMRDIEGDDGILESWNQAMKGQRLRKAVDSQSINITLLASTPMHDRLTFERSEAIKEKMDERLRAAGPGKLYEGWMDEIESKVAKYEGEQKEKRSLVVAGSKRQGKIPISNRSSQRAGSSASGASRPQEQRTPFVTVRNSGRESPMIVDVDDDDLEPRKRHPEKNNRHTFRAQDNNCIIDLE